MQHHTHPAVRRIATKFDADRVVCAERDSMDGENRKIQHRLEWDVDGRDDDITVPTNQLEKRDYISTLDPELKISHDGSMRLVVAVFVEKPTNVSTFCAGLSGEMGKEKALWDSDKFRCSDVERPPKRVRQLA